MCMLNAVGVLQMESSSVHTELVHNGLGAIQHWTVASD